MLKTKLTATEFLALSDDVKAHYKLGADGTHDLDLGPNTFVTDKDPAGLLSALEKERTERADARKLLDQFEADKKALETQLDTLKASGSGDTAKLTESFQNQLKEMQKTFEAKQKEQSDELDRQRVVAAEQQRTAKAREIATNLFKSNAEIMLPHVERFLSAKVVDGQPTVEILDVNTGTTALEQDFQKFAQQLSTNPTFKPMLVISGASGGSANGGNTGIPTGTKSDGTAKTFRDYSSGELASMRKTEEGRQLYEKLRSERS